MFLSRLSHQSSDMLQCCNQTHQKSERFMLFVDLLTKLEHLQVTHLSEFNIKFISLQNLNDLGLIMTSS